MAFADTNQKLTITRMGDVITICPAQQTLAETIASLRALPKAPPKEPVERTETRETAWD